MWTSQGCGPSTRITLSASAVTEERSEFITRTGSPWISPSWFSQSAGYFSRRERVSASNSLDIRALAAHKVSIKIRSDIGGHPRFPGTRVWGTPSAPILAASLRQEARERRIVTDVKPFIGTQRVNNPVRQSRASSRKRVLRGGGRLPLRSVDSEIQRCVIEPRNFLVVSPRRGQSRGPSQALAAPGPISVPGHTGV